MKIKSFQGNKKLNYKRLYNTLKQQYERSNRVYNDIKLFKISYRPIFGLIRQLKNTPTTEFIKKYHKNYKLYTSKLAYLAGLVDGEGYFKAEKQGTLRLSIGMCSKKTIYWIKNNFGGNICLQKTPKGRKFYVWRMNQGKDLFYLLLLLIPFLVTKKQIALLFFKTIINKFSKLEHTLSPYNWR